MGATDFANLAFAATALLGLAGKGRSLDSSAASSVSDITRHRVLRLLQSANRSPR